MKHNLIFGLIGLDGPSGQYVRFNNGLERINNPITAMFSVYLSSGQRINCLHPIAIMGVVDTLRQDYSSPTSNKHLHLILYNHLTTRIYLDPRIFSQNLDFFDQLFLLNCPQLRCNNILPQSKLLQVHICRKDSNHWFQHH